MKKKTASLRLDRQTIKQLSGDALRGAAAGQATGSLLSECGPSTNTGLSACLPSTCTR